MGALIGRRREVVAFEEVLAEVASGVGRVVAVAGEPGVGKSRLAGEFLARAEERGFRRLCGTACAYQSDLSYAPVVEALRPLVREAAADGPPDLARLFGGLPWSAPRSGDAALERTRLFEAIASLVAGAAERRPVAMLVDDLHWADPSSVDVLHYLGRAIARTSCLLVLTYRPSEAGAGVRAALASLRRGEWVVDLPLRPLGPEGVAAMVAELLGDSPPAPVVDLLADRTRGVPLFVRELVRALRGSGRLFRSAGRWVLGPDAVDAVPASVVELLRDRVDGLDSADRAVLEAVGVCADVATLDVLAGVCADVPEVADRLASLRLAGLVVEELVDGEVLYRAAHPLLAEAVYARLPPSVRQARHAAAADAIVRRGHVDASRLAHHVGRAGAAVEPARALEVLARGAEHAAARRAGTEGVQHARSALALAGRLGRDDLVPWLLTLLAESASFAGRAEEAAAAWWDAATRAADPRERSHRLLRLAQVETDAGRLTEARDHLAQAVEALRGLDATGLRVDIAQVALVLHTRRDELPAVAAEVAELERVAARSGNRRASALARYGRLELTGYGTGTVDESEVDEAIAAVAADGGAGFATTLQLISLGTALGRGEHAAVARRVDLAVEQARAADLPMLEVLPTAFCGVAQFQAGSWDSALALADKALALGHRFGVPRGISLALAARAMVLVHRGDVDDAETCLTEASANYRDRRLGRLIDVIAAQVALARRDLAGATALVPRTGPYALPVLHLGVRGELAVLARDHDEVGRVAADLRALGFPYAAAVADRLRGLAAGPDGVGLLTKAATALEELGLPFDAAACRLDRAAASAKTDPAAAVAFANRALATFDDLDAAPKSAEARRLLRDLGVRPKPKDRPAGELSAREAEVAWLVAQGLSNAAVARRLFLSPRTVTTHLEKIYRRLGLRSRRELARYVAERAADTQSRRAGT
ncbi:ATP-binding protein [Saccharothrix syringae]|uniref:ATP-binding protein n=1 Tax=Saccharothrix syringae TaxID=103733 RepID=UPI000B2970CD|nr:LuxR family transcriptional regulator [Saccharothrix syringae]